MHTHRITRCSSVHLERGEINHTLQKDESPDAVAPSKQEGEGVLEGRIILQIWRERQQQNVKTKDRKKAQIWQKKMFLKVSTAELDLCWDYNLQGESFHTFKQRLQASLKTQRLVSQAVEHIKEQDQIREKIGKMLKNSPWEIRG